MKFAFFSFLAIATLIHSGESYYRSDFIPDTPEPNQVKLTIDSSFGGSLIISYVNGRSRIHYIVITKDGKIAGGVKHDGENYIKAANVVVTAIKNMTKEQLYKMGMDGYNIGIQTADQKVTVWTPDDPAIVSALIELCIMATYPYKINPNNKSDFYPGKL